MLVGVVLAFAARRPLREWLQVQDGIVLTCEAPVQILSVTPDHPDGSASFQVRNISWDPVTIVTAETDCTCAAVSGLPVTVPPGSATTLTFRVEGDCREPGTEQTTQALLYTDVSAPRVVLTMIVRCAKETP